MALVTKEFKLDLAPGQLRPVVNASQGDIGRPFKADLYWNGSPWTATDYTAKLRGKKPDNTVFEYTATVSGSSVTFSTTEQMTIISGPVECELVFSNDGDVIASANFVLIVEDSPYNPDAPSESVIPGLLDLVEENFVAGTDNIGDNQVTTNKLANSAVTTAKLADGSVTSAKLGDSAVTNAKINDGAVGTSKLGASAVTSAKLADNAVETAKLADNAVETAKIKDAAVTNAKLAGGSVSWDKLASAVQGRITTAEGDIDNLEEQLTSVAKTLRKTLVDVSDYSGIQALVRAGLAKEAFNTGDQIVTTWNDGTNEYECPFDVVAFRDVEKEDGSVVPGMIIQAHYGFAGIQFDGNEAFYHCDSALAAGAYYVTMGNSWGSNVVSGKSYTFTLTQTVPAGGQLLFGTATSTTGALPDTAPANWRVWSYESQTSTEPIEKVTLSEGTTGTSLGTLSSSTKYGNTGLNNMQRASYGYNRWSQSGIRQNMNSSDPAGEWWTPQNVFDRPPLELATKRGFMAGFPSDFLEVLSPVKVVTALNTVSDSDIGASEVTYDTFFLPSLEEEYCVPQASGVEGTYWPYWKERLGINSPQASGSAAALTEHIRYSIENHTSPQAARQRSAYRGYACYTWFVTSTGYVTTYIAATDSLRFAPACVIC